MLLKCTVNKNEIEKCAANAHTSDTPRGALEAVSEGLYARKQSTIMGASDASLANSVVNPGLTFPLRLLQS